MRKRVVMFAIGLSLLGTLRSEIQLRGVLHFGGHVLLALADSDKGTAIEWVAVGGTFFDYTVEEFDSERETVRLRRKGGAVEVKLVKSSVRPALLPTDLSTVTDEELTQLGFHRVKGGDSLAIIAFKHKISVRDLGVWNQIADPSRLHVGDILTVAAPLASRTLQHGPENTAPSATKPEER